MDREHRLHRDEARVASHQFDEANAIDLRVSLHMRGGDGIGSFGHRRVEPKRLLHERNVVVHRFGYAHHRNFEPAALDFLGDGQSPLLGAVAAYRKSMFRLSCSIVLTISVVRSPPPREVPSMVPPILWMSSTTSGFSSTIS